MRFFCRFLAILAIYFFLAIPSFAAVVINEIMYAPEEGVAHEWFEIFNNGGNDFDLKDWRFSDGSNHVFEEPPKNGGQGSLVISPGVYAVIAKEANIFLSSHPGFSGTVIDGSFSLTDAGDTLSLIDANGLTVDTVTYGENAGAQKNGLSLQKINSVWQGGTPTPGTLNVSAPTTNANSSQQETATTSTSTTTATNIPSGSSFPVEPQIFASAGESKRIVIVGGTTTFSGRVWGLKKEPIENARMLWNFGDGSTSEGKTVAHTYRYTGTYIITLDASSGYYSASDRVTIEVVSADVIISSIGDSKSSFVELYNKSPYELDLSFWSIRAGNLTFIIPEHTFVAAGAKIKFAREVTGLPAATSTAQVGITSNTLASVALYYPNGIPANSYSPGTPLSISSLPTNRNQSVVTKKTTNAQVSTVQENTKNTTVSQDIPTQKEFPEENPQNASVGNAYPETRSLFWWITGVCALAFVGVASAFFTKRNPLLEPVKNEADAYEIIEEEDDKIPF
ncbi:MAG TPA: hypothetical protein DIU47_05000 [Candidatus Pacebacteria bacterium]|nr:hypothetical protein [Candidatus Paceibacterota bacterium]